MAQGNQNRKRDDDAINCVGGNIAKYRKLKGLSQRRLSILAELGHSKISLYESGSVDINISTLSAIAKALDIKLVQLFDE